MKKKNNKGFILVETLIVTVFVVTLFIFVYRATLPSIGEYEQQNYYDDIDSIYYSNLFKQMITRYANIDYIDNYLESNTYMDISHCTDSNIYSNNNYCQLLKNKLSIRDEDKILLTKYNIKDFKQEVKSNDYFDSGTLSNFRDYIKTVSNHEPFYANINSHETKTISSATSNDIFSHTLASVSNIFIRKSYEYTPSTNHLIGKYRLFIIRTVDNSDGSTSRRYSNIGVYTGTNQKFLMGDKVVFDPGDGEKEFYVLLNSRSTEETVTLILAQNLPGSTVCFNETKTSTIPTTVLDNLKVLTNGWSNVPYLTYSQETSVGYEINYKGYRARLLNAYDILNLLGCREDETTCFDPTLAFEVPFNVDKHKFLTENLTETNGYWTGMVVPNSDYYAWAVMKDKIAPVDLNDCINIGIRPIIEVEKTSVKRDEE